MPKYACFVFDTTEIFFLALLQEIFQGLRRSTEANDRNLFLLVVASGIFFDATEEQAAIAKDIEVVVVREVPKSFPGCFFSAPYASRLVLTLATNDLADSSRPRDEIQDVNISKVSFDDLT